MLIIICCIELPMLSFIFADAIFTSPTKGRHEMFYVLVIFLVLPAMLT